VTTAAARARLTVPDPSRLRATPSILGGGSDEGEVREGWEEGGMGVLIGFGRLVYLGREVEGVAAGRLPVRRRVGCSGHPAPHASTYSAVAVSSSLLPTWAGVGSNGMLGWVCEWASFCKGLQS
jgi:hypothetical protein